MPGLRRMTGDSSLESVIEYTVYIVMGAAEEEPAESFLGKMGLVSLRQLLTPL